MAAATVTAATANSSLFTRLLEGVQRKRVTSHPMRPAGFYAFSTGAVPVATTSLDDVGDEVYMVKFPASCYLTGPFKIVATDMDTNATPTLTFDVNIDDGSTETELINNSAAGQAGATDYADAPINWIDVSEKYLAIKVTAASATGAAGTVTATGTVFIGSPIALS